MKRLLLDVDGVLANMVQCYLIELYNTLNIHKEPSDVTEWCFKDALGLTSDQDRIVWASIQRQRVAFDMMPYPQALEWVPKLMRIADVHLITTPVEDSPTWAHDRKWWVRKHFGIELADKITSTSQKHICAGDVFVDDRLENVKKWADHNTGEAVLWKHNYNHQEHLRGFLHTNMWEDIYTLVREDT
jgi:5'(3')-deoxyribonucleotidase